MMPETRLAVLRRDLLGHLVFHCHVHIYGGRPLGGRAN